MRLNQKLVLCVLIWVFFPSRQVFTQGHKDSLSVLFVGNSYIYYENLPQIVSIISDSCQTKLITRKSTAGGARLRDHWLGNKELQTRQIIAEGNFDVVILQDQSMAPLNEPDSMMKYAGLLIQLIQETGARPWLYQTWAREKTPDRQKEITHMYAQVAQRHKANILPVGEAWEMAQIFQENTQLFTADGSHPAPNGAFLTACVMVMGLTGELPQKMDRRYYTLDQYGESLMLLNLDGSDVNYLQKIARDIYTVSRIRD